MLINLLRKFSVAGRATSEGTLIYTQRNNKVVPSHWTQTYQGLHLSSVGIGTYIGAPDSSTDELVSKAIIDSVRSGTLNVIDTAINYRYQKAERSVRTALKDLLSDFGREELFISSKIGYIPEDADSGETAEQLKEKLRADKIIQRTDIVGEVHCMHPNYLEHQLNQSLSNLGLETVDLMYLHNAAESQLPLIKGEEFDKKLGLAFEFFEKARTNNKINLYGLATWICFRALPSEKDLMLSLEKVVQLAEKVGGNEHGMRFVQLPINLMMPEAFVQPWQPYQEEKTYFLNVAKALGINVAVSSPLMQGKILELKLSKSVLRVEPQACKHAQLIRSIPSESIKSVLIGMKNPRNVTMNQQLAFTDKLTAEEFWNALKPEGKEDAEISIKLW